MQILCILLALLMLPFAAEAREAPRIPTLAEVVKTLPPELLYNGKPLDPGCVEATNPPDGPTAEQDLKTCSQDAKREPEVFKDGMLGFAARCGQEFCGYTGYRYLGKMGDGFVILTHNDGGGSGQFSSIRLLKRKGEVINTEFIHPTGDRCIGGVLAAEMKNGMLEYSYSATLTELADVYGQEANIPILSGSAADCAAVIRNTGGVISAIEFKRTEEQLADDPACFAEAYREQAKKGTTLSTEQMKEFFNQAGNICEQEQAE